MGRKFPCSAKDGWVYKEGKVCSKCEKCPGGHGRDMSKQVLNATGIYGDMECIKCEACPPKTYNNGGRRGCRNCFENCPQRNRHNCSDKAIQPCGECFSGFYEEYQEPNDPSICIPCTEKEIGIFTTCGNFTTTKRSATTSAIDGHTFADNVSEKDVKTAIEMRNGHSTDGTSIRIDLIVVLSSICSLVAILVVACFIYRYCKKRRKKGKGKTHDAKKTPSTASACPLLVSSSGESVSVAGPSSERKEDKRQGTEINLYISDTDSAPEEDSEAVPPTVDPGMWEHRRELLKSNNTIWRKCAQLWTDLGKEYQALSIPSNTIEQLKKDREDKQWPNAEFCYEILKSWTQIKGDQATVKVLCDALFKKGYNEMIRAILLSDV